MPKAQKKIIERIRYKNVAMTRSLSEKGDVSVDQIKAARSLLGWSQADLAKKSGYSLPAINNIERGLYEARSATMDDLIQTFEENGIEFIDGPGVRIETSAFHIKAYEGEDALTILLNKMGLAFEKKEGELLLSGLDENFLQQNNADDIKRLQMRLKNNPNVKVRILCYRKQSAGLTFSNFEKKIVPDTVPLISCAIYQDRVATVVMKNPIHVAIMYNEILANEYTKYFNYIWTASK